MKDIITIEYYNGGCIDGIIKVSSIVNGEKISERQYPFSKIDISGNYLVLYRYAQDTRSGTMIETYRIRRIFELSKYTLIFKNE